MSDRQVNAIVFGFLTVGVVFNLSMWIGYGFAANGVFAAICAFWLVVACAVAARGRRAARGWSEFYLSTPRSVFSDDGHDLFPRSER